MAKLDDEQIAFLASQGLSPADLFDASGMSKREREAQMETAGKRFFYGGARCKKGGHTLRAKAGHCIQCRPQNIAYSLRYSKKGCVYIAGTMDGQAIKVGVAADVDARLRNLCSEKYAGLADWVILASTCVIEEAGKIEHQVQSNLSSFATSIEYQKRGVAQKAQELFRCSLATALQSMIDVLGGTDKLAQVCSITQAKKYEWRRVT